MGEIDFEEERRSQLEEEIETGQQFDFDLVSCDHPDGTRMAWLGPPDLAQRLDGIRANVIRCHQQKEMAIREWRRWHDIAQHLRRENTELRVAVEVANAQLRKYGEERGEKGR